MPTLWTPWTVVCQALLSMGFPRQEYWGGLPFPASWDLPDTRTKTMSPALAGGFFATEPSGKPTECNACVLSSFSYVQLCVTLWTVAHQPPLFMGFCRKEHWSRLSCPPPGDLPNPGIEPRSLMSPALAGGFFTTSATWEAPIECNGPY